MQKMRLLPWKPKMLILLSMHIIFNFHLSNTYELRCPNDYKEVINQELCYKVFSDLVLWEEALELCFNESAYLSQFQNDLNISHIRSIEIDDDNIDVVWVSLKRINNYFQWMGMHPQLFKSVKKEWGLHWKENDEPKTWDGCGAVDLNTGDLYSKSCQKTKLPFVCVKPIDSKFNPTNTDFDEIDVRLVAVHQENEDVPLTKDYILWVNEDNIHHIILECQVRINGTLMKIESEDSGIQIVWSKNGMRLHSPVKSSISPSYWVNPTPWVANIGRINDFLGTYLCEANIPFQTRRHPSNTISLFINGTIMFKYNVKLELEKEIKVQEVEPTSSKIFSVWYMNITRLTESILSIEKPHVVDAIKIEWLIHYIKPLSEVNRSDGNWTKNISISMFIAVKTQSENERNIRQKLWELTQKFKQYTVEIVFIGKCPILSELDISGTNYTWSMKLGQSRGFSSHFCVTSEPKFEILSRQCKASYEDMDKWKDFDYSQCTSKITHMLQNQFCPKGHRMINDDFCAVNGSTNSTWKEARDECIKKGSHLPHNAHDIFATDQNPVSSWSVARLNGRRVYPGPPQNFSGQNWTECVILNRTHNPIWQGAVCAQKHSFICLSRIQDTLWRVPWCPRGGWLGSEIPILRNTCFFINYSMIVPEHLKSFYCHKKNATVANTSDPLIYILVSATIWDHRNRATRRKRSLQIDNFVDIPYLVCQKPKATRSPRKANLVLKYTQTQTGIEDKYPIFELICHGINVRPNSRTVWYHNGDPYPELDRRESNETDYLAAAEVKLDEAKQGDYWCEAWDNNAQSTVTSNKITLTLPGIINCVIVLNTSNSDSPIRDVFELSKISYYFNEATSNIVRREATLLPDGQMVIWVHGNSYRSEEDVISDVRFKFENHLKTDSVMSANLPPIIVRSTEWCMTETTTDNGNTLVWPQTKRNHASLPKQLCFTKDGYEVSRECIGDFRQGAYWGPVNGECTGTVNKFTESLYNLSESEVTKDNALSASQSLDQLTDSKSTYNYRSVDIAYIAKTMQKISNTGNVTNETLKNVVDIVDRVMNVDSEKILLSQESSRSSNTITQTLEKMIDSVPLEQGHPLHFSLPNIYVEAHLLTSEPDDMIVGVASYHQQQITLTSAGQLNYSYTDAALLLPISLVEERKQQSGSDGLRMYFVVYHNSKLFPTKNATVNSKVVAASLPNQSVQNCEPPIKLVFRPLQEMSMESVSCTYWDPRLNNGKGDWSTAGCRLQSSQRDQIVCLCNHLTNFAVLMDMYGQESRIEGTHRHILDIITYVGSALSILGLSLTILTFLLFSKWRKKDGNKIICNLALALLLLLIVFLAGIERTHSPAICQAVAILLHYFILSSFCWMLVEAIQQYLLFVRVLATYIPRFLLKSMIFAWGLPLIIIIIVIGIDLDQYVGGHHYCWMKLDALYYSFLLPVGIIMFVNAIVFILVLRGITCGRRSNLRSNQSKQQLMKTQVYAAICIFVLLGLTWLFGFLAIDEARLIFQYVFCVCNSLQGLLIFVFMVVRDRNAHDLWTTLCTAKKTSKTMRTTTSGGHTRREEANMSENFTTKLMISRTSTHSPT